MIKSPEIKVNPEVLKTLRESSGYTVEEIAKKIKTSVAKVQEVEKGLASFTLTQIKKLADIYQRSRSLSLAEKNLRHMFNRY